MNELTDSRKEKASEFLTYWAFRLYQDKPIIEQAYAFFTGGNSMTDAGILIMKKTVTVGFSAQMNAKQDRSPGYSKPILGGVMLAETHERRAVSIDKLLSVEFSPRQRLMTFYLFLPRDLYKIEKLTDRRIAKAAGYCPKRACEIKYRAIDLVAKQVLGPKGEMN